MSVRNLFRILLLVLVLLLAGAASAARISRDGWSVQLPPGAAKAFELVPALPLYDPPTPENPAPEQEILKPDFYNMPQHLRVSLAPHDEKRSTYFAPRLHLIPVEPYLSILDPANGRKENTRWMREQFAALRQWLAGAPEAVSDWPFIPFLDMSPQYTVQRRALGFGGGRGIRVLTQFVPDVGLAQSGQLSYVFQGLTTDGRYYVLLTMPLSLPGLPGRDDDTHLGFSIQQLDTDRDACARYEAAIDTLLRKREKELQPALAELDAVVASLRWKPDAAAAVAQP